MSEKTRSDVSGFCIQITESFVDAEPFWRALEQTGDAIVFQTYDWQAAWHQLIGRQQRVRPCIAIVTTDDDRPLMLLPLGIVRRGLGRALIWLGGELTDYNGPVLAADAALYLNGLGIDGLWRRLRHELPAFDYVDFQRLPAEIGNQHNPFVQLSNRGNPIAGRCTRLGSSWETYHNGKRSAETRRKERKKEGKLGLHGPIEFVVAQTTAEIDRIVAALVAQKSASYQRKGVKNLFRDPAYVDFLKAFAHDHVESGLAVLAAVKVDDEIIATQWGLIYGNRFYCLVYGHDQGRFARYSPGNVLLRRLLEWCCERDIDVFDFTYGDESYKDHWCEDRLALHDCLLPSSPLGSVIVLGIRCSEGVRLTVKRSSHVHAFVTGIRKLWYQALAQPRPDARQRFGSEPREAARENEPNAEKEWNKA
ncbi:MAG: GNAT family N-acetyltransferase [Geminicoccaceae bacterium]